MNIEETKEAIRVMQAFVDGKKIIYEKIFTDSPTWNWYETKYEIADEIQQPTYRPFKNAEEFKPYRDKYFKYKNCDFPTYVKTFSYNDSGIKTINGACFTWKDMFEECTFEDGSPCGVSVEQKKLCGTCANSNCNGMCLTCNNRSHWEQK